MATATPYALGQILLNDPSVSQVGADGARRTWVMLLPEGEYEHPKGTLKLTRPMLDEVKRNFDSHVRGVDIALDYDHRASEGDSRAFGWIEAVEYFASGRAPLREQLGGYPSGLWALVKWTTLGLKDVGDQIYRYISAEYRPDWTNPVNNKTYHNVLIGATLTNRPFMNHMPAIQLSEVSTTPWSSIDKSKLPNSAFLDPKNRRLPIYEGAGSIGADGRYSERGKLNIHGVKAALGAIHGARSGKPMSGLPSGLVSRLQGILDRYEGKKSGGKSGDKGGESGEAGSREMSMARMTHLNGLLGDQADTAEDEDLELEDLADFDLTDLDDTGDDGDEEYDEGDDDSGDDYAMDADAQDEGDQGSDEEQENEAPARGRSRNTRAKRGSREMSEEKADTISLAEVTARLAEVERERNDYALKLRENAIDRRVHAWEAPPVGEAGGFIPSKAFTDKYRAFMLSDGITLSEGTLKEFDALLDEAFASAIETGQRSLATADMDSRISRTAGQTGDQNRLMEVMEQIAQREYGKSYRVLLSEGSKDAQVMANVREIANEAMRETGYDVRRLSEDIGAQANGRNGGRER
jgi:Mu-like prophage I protein